jgi:hypothetical protein
MKTIHQTVAKTLRYSGYKATCINNRKMDHQPYEVIVNNISGSEANELQQMFSDMYKNSMINIIAK